MKNFNKQKRPTLDERLARYTITGTGCWEWHGQRNKSGYGKLKINYKMWSAHRASYHYKIGPIPDGMCVLHRCDNPICINPSHLFLGTHTENMRDMMAKGRHVVIPKRGEDNHIAKLTPEIVRKIRAEYVPRKVTLATLGAKYGVCEASIWYVVKRTRWGHVTD